MKNIKFLQSRVYWIFSYKFEKIKKYLMKNFLKSFITFNKVLYIVNSKNEISSTMSQKRFELFRNHFRVISQVNKLSKFNDRDKNLKVIRFLIQFDSNIHNRTQSFIIIINLNNTDRHVIYLIHIILIIYWSNRKHSILNTMIVIFEVLSKEFMWHLFYVCELLFKTYLNSFQVKSI